MVVHVDETTPIRGVLLTFFGRMKIYWKTIDGGGTQEFCEIEDYLDDLNAANQRRLDERRFERRLERMLETRLERAFERWLERRLDDVGEAVRQFWQMAMLGPRYIQ